MKKILLLILLVNFYRVKSQNYVLIPDSNFASWLHGHIPAAMNSNSLNITHPLVTIATQTMDLDYFNIHNLFGIQYFSSLTELYCYSTSLTTIPALPNSLKVFWCQQNFLTSLPALPPSLELLYCYSNSLTSLPVLPNSLKDLRCFENSLTFIPTLPNSLQFLLCGFNPLNTLPNLSDSLQYLNCKSNFLTNLPILPNSLEYLYCEANSLSNLPNLPGSLKLLSCNANLLTSLPALPNSLKNLYCTDNLLTNLPKLPDSLQALICNHNNISCFPFFPNSILSPTSDIYSNLTLTYYINLDNNPFNCLPNYLQQQMPSTLLTYPLCGPGNQNGCAISYVGITELKQSSNELIVYPNPVNEQLNIELNTNEIKTNLILTNTLGQQVFAEITENKLMKVNTKNFPEGMYLLTIKTQQGSLTKKVLIEH